MHINLFHLERPGYPWKSSTQLVGQTSPRTTIRKLRRLKFLQPMKGIAQRLLLLDCTWRPRWTTILYFQPYYTTVVSWLQLQYQLLTTRHCNWYTRYFFAALKEAWIMKFTYILACIKTIQNVDKQPCVIIKRLQVCFFHTDAAGVCWLCLLCNLPTQGYETGGFATHWLFRLLLHMLI